MYGTTRTPLAKFTLNEILYLKELQLIYAKIRFLL